MCIRDRSKRWLTEVMFSIEEGNVRFSSIKEDLKYISDNVLADRLKLLEKYKLIVRTESVSYTHLDVYKRQPFSNFFLK